MIRQPAQRSQGLSVNEPSLITQCCSVSEVGFAALLRSAIGMRRDRLALVGELHRHYGDVVSLRFGPRRFLFIRCPHIARDILGRQHASFEKGLGLQDAVQLFGKGLLTADGDAWLEYRRRIAPHLGPARVSSFLDTVHDALGSAIKVLDHAANTGSTVDVYPMLARMAAVAVARGVLAAELNENVDVLVQSLSHVTCYAEQSMVRLLNLPMTFPTRRKRELQRALDLLNAWAYAQADRALANSAKSSGLLVELVRQGVTDRRQLRDEALTFLQTGYETTAATLAWALLLVAEAQEVQAQVAAEADAVLTKQSAATHDLRQFTFTRAVVEETLRLWPAVWMVPRRAKQTIRIADGEFPAGTDVLIVLWAIQRHPAYWPEPDRFRPDRFLVMKNCGASMRAYMPFGLGPRTCVGRHFGFAECVLALATLVLKFEFRPERYAESSAIAGLTLRPRHGRLHVQRRHRMLGEGVGGS